MKKNATSLVNIAKKPGKYVHDIDELKTEIQSLTEVKAQPLRENESNIMTENLKPQADPIITNDRKTNRFKPTEQMVALHIPVPIELRDKLKIKAINEGEKMKDLLLRIIQDYAENN